MAILRVARRGNSLAALACGSFKGLSMVSLTPAKDLGAQRSAAGPGAALATMLPSSQRRSFAAAGANLEGVDAATLRAEAAAALAESDDEGLDAYGAPSFPYVPPDPNCPAKVLRKNGVDLLHDPLYNRGTAFTMSERERLKLRGLLPPRVLSQSSQVRRFLLEYREGRDYVDPNEIEESGISHESVRKWKALADLKDRNETLFYSVLCQNLEEMAPIVYTPTVGYAAVNYHRLYRRPRGFHFSAVREERVFFLQKKKKKKKKNFRPPMLSPHPFPPPIFFFQDDVGEMESMIWNCPNKDVDAIVITDGSRILGLGDLSLNGLAIPVGKLDLVSRPRSPPLTTERKGEFRPDSDPSSPPK